MRVDVSPEAQRDLASIAAYIARDNPVAAEQWVARLEAAAAAVGGNPKMGRVVPELRNESVREVFVRDYRVVYVIEPRRVVVLTVFHGSLRLRPKKLRTPPGRGRRG